MPTQCYIYLFRFWRLFWTLAKQFRFLFRHFKMNFLLFIIDAIILIMVSGVRAPKAPHFIIHRRLCYYLSSQRLSFANKQNQIHTELRDTWIGAKRFRRISELKESRFRDGYDQANTVQSNMTKPETVHSKQAWPSQR